MRFQNGSNKVVIELRVVLVISNRTRAASSFDFEITRIFFRNPENDQNQVILFIK